MLPPFTLPILVGTDLDLQGLERYARAGQGLPLNAVEALIDALREARAQLEAIEDRDELEANTPSNTECPSCGTSCSACDGATDLAERTIAELEAELEGMPDAACTNCGESCTACNGGAGSDY